MTALVRRNPEFRRIFLAHAISRVGDAFNTVALVVLVFQLTGSGLGVAGAVALEVVPVLLLAPWAGLLADRMPRRTLMVSADLARAALALLLALRPESVPAAYLVAFGLACGALVFNPAASALLPEVVNDDEVVDANTSLWTVAVAAQVVLAPAAGGLISVFGPGVAFAVNAASYVISAAMLIRLGAGRNAAASPTRHWATDVIAGAQAVLGTALLRRLAVVQVLASLSAGATSGLLIVLAERQLGVGPAGFGWLLAAIGIGAAIGPLLLKRFIKPRDRAWLFGPYAARAAVDLTLATTSNQVVATAALGVYGMSTSTGMIAYQSTLQTSVAPDVRGRSFAFFDVLWNGARLVSLGLGGILADAVGVRVVYLSAAALLGAAAVVGFTAGHPCHSRMPRSTARRVLPRRSPAERRRR